MLQIRAATENTHSFARTINHSSGLPQLLCDFHTKFKTLDDIQVSIML